MNPPEQTGDTEQALFPFTNSYAELPERFHARVSPRPVRQARLVVVNLPLSQELGLDPDRLRSAEGVAVLAGNAVAEGSRPLAAAYAGHQFGHFVPQLGDGRAHLIGGLRGRDGRLYDLQLKGSGPTPFSRRGDGRAALGPVLREYVVSEAMHALRVPTTRALAAVLTGEQVAREQMLPGAVLTRVAASHVRVGTFQFFAARGDVEALRVLARYVLDRHYPELAGETKPFTALLQGVVVRQARLVAQWMLLGFIHGVMNTDNMSVSGETIDYGPCAFLEAYDPAKVYSSIDTGGRYRYANQPDAAHWNLTRLAEAMLPLLEEEQGSEAAALDAARGALDAFAPEYDGAWLAGMRRKLGLRTAREGDEALAQDLLARMAAGAVDWTSLFAALTAAVESGSDEPVRERVGDWAGAWRGRLLEEDGTGRQEAMRRANPVYIPRNHLVEEAIQAGLSGDFAPFSQLVEVCTHPFTIRQEWERYGLPARPEQCVQATFCGT